MEKVKITITVSKPSGYTSTKSVDITEEVLGEIEKLIKI